jgi:hypothetical protein
MWNITKFKTKIASVYKMTFSKQHTTQDIVFSTLSKTTFYLAILQDSAAGIYLITM